MARENWTDSLEEVHGGFGVPLLTREKMQKPKATGQEADPLKVSPAIPDIVIVPSISAGHVVQTRYSAMQLKVGANSISSVAKMANGLLKRSLVVFVHVSSMSLAIGSRHQMTDAIARSSSASPSSSSSSLTMTAPAMPILPPHAPQRPMLPARP